MEVQTHAASILLVDDDLKMQSIVAEVLRHEGYLVLTATNGHDALSMMERNPVDMVLLDIKLPDIDGIAPRHRRAQQHQRMAAGIAMALGVSPKFGAGKVTKIEFTMPDAFHTFRRGHRVMVQVQSSWFPLVDRNPQKFVNIYEARR